MGITRTFYPDGTMTETGSADPPVYRKLTRAALDDILEEVFGADRYSAIISGFSGLSANGWLVARRKFDNPNWAPTRDQIDQLLRALRAADVPTALTKITLAEITAVANHASWQVS